MDHRIFHEEKKSFWNQLEVMNTISARNKPSKFGSIVKIVSPGIYHYADEIGVDDDTWYLIGEDIWIRNDSCKIYPKSDENDDKRTNYVCFVAPKDDVYYIRLKKNEKIYYEKRD